MRYALVSKVGATGAGSVYKEIPRPAILQAFLEGTSGSISATILVYGSNDATCLSSQSDAAKDLIVTFILSGTGGGSGVSVDQEVWQIVEHYEFLWAEVTSISGTGAKASVVAASQRDK